jgi:hypothetical protein
MRRRFLALGAGAVVWLKAQTPVFDVTAHGAKGDGQTLDTAAIQKAIDACHSSGGGVVYFPNGKFLTGAIELKSHCTLRISPGATLEGSRKIEDYVRPHLIYARGAENIGIDGGGVINGNGDAFWDADFRPRGRRPSPLLELVESKDIRIENIRIRNTPGWGIHPLLCDRVTIRGISMVTDYRGPNTDGIDPDSTRNLTISDSYIETGDDAIVMKTTGRLGRPAPPCENITITNCILMSDDAAIKLGTESHGDFRHIRVSNCVIRKSSAGVAIYGKDGGTMEDISFSGLSIETSSTRRTYPIYVDLDRRTPESRQSRIRDVTFSDITMNTKGRILLTGMAEQPLEGLVFRNLFMRIIGFETLERASQPRGAGTVKPVARRINRGPTPAAFTAANVQGLNLDGFRIRWDGPPGQAAPERHALYLADSEQVTIRGFQGRQAVPAGKLAAIALDRVTDVLISDSKPDRGTGVFLGRIGGAAEEITLTGNDLRHATKERAEGAVYVAGQ